MAEEEPKLIEEPTTPPGEEDPPAPGAEDEGSPPAGEDPPAKDPKDGVQQRIDELTRKRRDAERDAAYWRGVAETKAKEPSPSPEPKADLDPNDFNSDAEYLKATADRMRDEIRAEAKAEREKERADALKVSTAATLQASRAKHSDFDSVALNVNIPVTQSMYDAAMGDNFGEVLYYLGSNPTEASRISALPPIQQAKEIGKVEVRLTSAPPKNKTKAPNPPPLIDGGGGSPPPKRTDQMTRAELHAKWDADRRREAGVAA